MYVVSGVDRVDAHQQRIAPRGDVVEIGERHVRVLAQCRLDPMLLRLFHRDPVRPGGHDDVLRGPSAEDVRVAYRNRFLDLIDIDVHRAQPLDQMPDVGELTAGHQEVRPDLHVRHRELHRVLRLNRLVRLQRAGLTLGQRVHPGPVVAGQDLALVGGGPAERRPLGGELLLDPVLDGRGAAFLVRHSGRPETGGRNGVAVSHVEQVVGVVVEIALGGDRVRAGAVVAEGGLVRLADPVDPVDRRVGDLVVDRVRVRREEVPLAAHLVGVDEDLRRESSQQFEFAVGLRLGAREPVAVQVEAEFVLPPQRVPAVRILGRQNDRDQVVVAFLDLAGEAGRQLVERFEGRVGAARLAAVHIAGDPDDGRLPGGDPAGPGGRQRPRIPQAADLVGDIVQVGLPLGDHGVVQRLAEDAPAHRAGDHAIGGPVHRAQVVADLGVGDDPLLARAERETEERLRARHRAEVGGRVGDAVGARGGGARRGGAQGCHQDDRRGAHQAFRNPHRVLVPFRKLIKFFAA